MKKLSRTARHSKPRCSPIQLLLVGAYPLILEALKLCFAPEPHISVIGGTNGTRESLRAYSGEMPDVILVDATSGNEGAETIARLKSRFPSARVIALTASADQQSVAIAVRAGARGCLLKDCCPPELFAAIESVNSGGLFFSPAISLLGQREFVRALTSESRNGIDKLKQSERRLLELIANGFTNKEMASELAMSVRTVEKYRESLTSKLGIRTVAGLTKFAIRHGIASLE